MKEKDWRQKLLDDPLFRMIIEQRIKKEDEFLESLIQKCLDKDLQGESNEAKS